MRFRYFDSAGNEVSLSTAAALAVKIDLGEVTETTLLYDAACDEWAPAGEQEIYRHIVEHGSPAPEDEAPADLPPDVSEPSDGLSADTALPEPTPRTGDRSGRPDAPPLEDFWGPAMSTSPGEEEAMESFDLSLEDMGAAERAEARSGESDEDVDPLSLDAVGEARAGGPGGPATAGAEEAPSVEERGKAAPDADGPATSSGKGPEASAEPSVERPAAASSSEKPAQGDTAPPTRRRGRRRDASLAKLEEIAREAAARMEREEAARRRGPGPTLADRVTESARKGGQKTGEALKTGAAASARALSDGGKATAESLGTGMRELAKRARKAGPKIRRGFAAVSRNMGSGASGFASMAAGAGRRIGSAASAGVRGLGVAVRFAGRATRAVFLAPVRGAAGAWRMIAPIGGRAGRDARKAVGAGMRGFRRAVFSPLALGLFLFVGLFLFIIYGGGREAGEELWQATVGIARSVAAEAGSPNEPVGEAGEGGAEAEAPGPGADATGSGVGPTPEGEPGDAPPGTPAEPAGPGGAVPVVADDSTIAARDARDEALLAEFERELTLASEGALQDMIAGMDSLERVYQLPEAPPEEWLGGYYLSNASEFHTVRQYWARYRGYIRSVKAQDGVLYRRGLQSRFVELGVPRERLVELTGLAERRFREGRLRRDSLYDAMAAVAEAAVDLHDFLTENQAGIEYDPVRPGRISREPVLEAYATTPELKREMDARLDRILKTMERVHGLKPVFTRELQDLLFSSLQAAEAVDTFRLRPRTAPPDSGGAPPGG